MPERPEGWPDFPFDLLAGRPTPETQRVWERAFRQAREASWHGPFEAMPQVDMVVHHHDACEVLSDGERFPQHLGAAFRELALLNEKLPDEFLAAMVDFEKSALINQDGEYHRALRALFGWGFSGKRVKALRPFISALALRLVDAMQPGDDFATCFAAHVPPTTMCEVIGIPEEERGIYAEHVSAVLALIGRPLGLLTMDAERAATVVAGREAATAYFISLLERRRADPQDDLTSHLACAPDCPLDDRALALNLGDLLYGGSDNTQRTLNQMVLLLTEYPDVWDAVAEEPKFAERVVEECLRFRPASPGPFRRTAGETRYRDATWPSDQVLWLTNLSVNRDESVFDRGSEFDPDRSNVRSHLSFGHGVHHCLGASIARAELQESLRVLTATMTCPATCGEVVVVNDGGTIGPVSLPIAFERRG
jgi:cytochrome P450